MLFSFTNSKNHWLSAKFSAFCTTVKNFVKSLKQNTDQEDYYRTDLVLMEEFTIFRLFLCFPLIGLLIPDVGLVFSEFGISHIPLTHLIIEITLSVCMIVCSVGVSYLKRKLERKAAEDKSLISV